MKLKPAVTIIELLLGIALASIISTLLYNAFSVVNLAISKSQPLLDADPRLVILYNQLQKDIQGTFNPVQPEQPSSAAKEQVKAVAQNKKEEKPIDKIFYSVNAQGKLETLTFVTNNPVSTYRDAKKGELIPADVVRVMYRVVAEANGTFSITRQESQNLAIEAFAGNAQKAIRSFELANNIKNISMEYAFSVSDDQQEKKQVDKKTRLEKRDEWRYEEWRKQDEKKLPPRIPQFVTMKVTFFDASQQQESVHVLMFEIPTFGQQKFAESAVAESKKPEEAKQDSATAKEPASGAPVSAKPTISALSGAVLGSPKATK